MKNAVRIPEDTGGRAAPAKIVTREPLKRQSSELATRRRTMVLRVLLGCLIPVGLFLTWELFAHMGWIDARFFSRPSEVIERGLEDAREGDIWTNVRITVTRLLIGFVAGASSGVLVGLLLSQSRLLTWLFEPTLRALYVIPKLAILPLLLLVFGLGEMPKLIFIGLGTFYIVAFTTLSAASLIPTAYHEAATSYRLSSSERFRWLVFPASLPQIIGSLRVASGIAMLLVVAVEFVNANDGIGFYTWHAWTVFIPARMFVGVVIISVIGVTFSTLVGLLGGLAIRWADDEYRRVG